MKIGIISDTHGLLREEVVEALQGVDMILHAGDIDTPLVLADLKLIAPVIAVRGNMDHGGWAYSLKKTEYVECEGHLICIVHDLGKLDIDPVAAQCSVVISGHTHKPLIRRQGGMLYLNPGSAGPRRFHLPVSMAILTIIDSQLRPELITLPV
ncbi:metallophosphoesterase family protein [bacterium]|nr:metallophosphoesterase family protein [bacterium]